MRKLPIFILMLIVLMSFAYADLTTDLGWYYTMDDADIYGTNFYDYSGNGHNGTLTNTPDTGVAGVLGEAINFTVDSNQWMTVANTFTMDSTWTLCYAFKMTDPGDFASHFRFESTSGGGYVRHLQRTDLSVHQFDIKDDSAQACSYSIADAAYIDNAWHFICLIRNTTTNDCSKELYADIDGARVALTTSGTVTVGTTTADSNKYIGNDNAEDRGGQNIDNIMFYDADIGSDNRALLYNSGNLCNPVDNPTGCGGAPPAVDADITCTTNLTSYTNSSENPLYFGLNCVGGVDASTNIFNISLYLNNTLNTTILDFNLNTTILTLNLTYGDEQVGYDINITVTHGEDEANYTTKIIDVFLDSVTPYIEFLSPVLNNSIYYRGFDSFVNLTVYCDDPNLYSCNITLKRVNESGIFNETLNSTIFTGITTPNQTASVIRSIASMADGYYAAIATSADSHTAADLKFDIDKIDDYNYNYNGILITSDKELKPTKEKDKYIFEIEKKAWLCYNSENGFNKVPDSTYHMHYIDFEQKIWVDEHIYNFIETIEDGKITQLCFFNDKDEKYVSKSIGDLNINQQIYYFNVTQNNFAFNIWIYDEDNPSTQLIGDAEVEIEYYVGSNPNASYYYADLSGGSNYAINISSNESLIRAFVYIKYEIPNGFVNRYFAVNTTYNTTNGYNFTLYGLNTTTAIAGLKITARNYVNYNYYPNVIGKLQRKYVSEGVWRTVQMDQSGDFGVLYYNIREAEVDYRIIFIDLDNNILKTTDTLKFICTDDLCDLTTLINPYAATATIADITASYSYSNTTKLISFAWTNNDGDTSTVVMRARQDRAGGAIFPCNVTQTAAAGTYNCNMTGYSGLFEITVIGDGTILLSEWLTIESAKLGDLIDQKEGALWSAMLLIVFVGFGIFSPVGAIIASTIGLILIYLLGIFTPLTITIIIIATIIGVVIGFKIRT